MLVELNVHTRPIIVDLKYATMDNFTGHQIYQKPLCLLHDDAVRCFDVAIELAARHNLMFKVYDAFRPQLAQQALWDVCPNDMYVMPPEKGSVHTRGVAIDLTLVDSQGNDLDMGTPFDDFTEKSHHGAHLTREAECNRYLLLAIMSTAGFDFYRNEWWHYQLFNPKNYVLIQQDYGIMSK